MNSLVGKIAHSTAIKRPLLKQRDSHGMKIRRTFPEVQEANQAIPTRLHATHHKGGSHRQYLLLGC